MPPRFAGSNAATFSTNNVSTIGLADGMSTVHFVIAESYRGN